MVIPDSEIMLATEQHRRHITLLTPSDHIRRAVRYAATAEVDPSTARVNREKATVELLFALAKRSMGGGQ